MKLFEVKNWELQVSEEAWGFVPFKKILSRDRTKDKSKAFKEMFFIWNYSDIKSDYLYITDKQIRAEEIRKDIGLPKGWKIDKVMDDAIKFYEERSKTIIEELYEGALISASAVTDYLKNTKILLAERDTSNKPIYQLTAIVNGIKSVKIIMRDLKAVYAEVVKEKSDVEDREKGNKTFNTFEDGINFEENDE